MLALAAWRWLGLPPIARGPDAEYAARVQAKFPLGMAELDLVRELRNQGFGAPLRAQDISFHNSATGERIRVRAQDPDMKYATFSSFSFPCDVTWWVLWHSDQEGRIADIRGTVGGSCL